MLDSEIVAAVEAEDVDGLAAAYDRYAAPLYAFCCLLLTDSGEAADAVEDTFVIAASRLGCLRDHDRLKPWLYAVARNECHRRLRSAPAGSDEAGGPARDTVDFGANLEHAELRQVVSAAMARLDAPGREAVELSLRQDFSADELAAVLGLSRRQARVLADRACARFEAVLAPLLSARSGRAACDSLDELVEGWHGRLTAQRRKAVDAHVEHCGVCTERRRRELRPAMLLSLLPAVTIARGLRQQVLDLAASSSPDVVAYRAGVVARAEPFGASGFPVPVDPPSVPERRARTALAVAAVAVIAVIGAVALVSLRHHGTGQRPPGAAPGTPTASPRAPSAASRHALSRRQHPAGRTTAAPSSTPTVTATSSSAPPSPAIRTHQPAPPGLAASPPGVILTAQLDSATGSFTLTASGGRVAYDIIVPAPYSLGLHVDNPSGSLAAGQSVTITVTWDSSIAPVQTALTIGPDGLSVPVSYSPA